MTIMGTRVLRKEDPAFLTTGARYTADLDDPRLDGALHATFVRSYVAHGRIESVDADEARRMPGVAAVLTGADLPEDLVLRGAVPMFPAPMLDRPLLARDRVRFVGEAVAVVLTEEPAQGEDAAEAVFVEIDPLEAVVDLEAAARDDIVILPEVGTNVCLRVSDVGMASGLSGDEFFAVLPHIGLESAMMAAEHALPEARPPARPWPGGIRHPLLPRCCHPHRRRRRPLPSDRGEERVAWLAPPRLATLRR